jgi:hypothetical protein
VIVSLGAVGPVIHRLWTWTALITDHWLVACRFPARIHMIHRLIGAADPTQWPCDAPTVLRDIQDHSLMAVVVVKCGSNLILLIKLT